MSRRSLKARDPRYDMIIGWDPPLESFFAQVTDSTVEDEDDRCVAWLGSAEQILTPAELSKQLGEHGPLSAEHQLFLAADRYVNDGMITDTVANELAVALLREPNNFTVEGAIDALMAQPLATRGHVALTMARTSGLLK